jgi:hypothetical protein
MIGSHLRGTIPLSSLDDSLTALYVFVDDFLLARPDLAAWRHSPNQHPAFSDAEVLTIALLQSELPVASLKQTYRLIAANTRAAFPRLCSYARWIARVHALAVLLGTLLRVTTNLTSEAPAFYLVDAKPLPVCHRIRHRRVRLLREEGAYWGKTSKGWFFGFKLHVLRHIDGRVVNLVLTPGNWDDRAPALTLFDSVAGGVTLGDLGYRGKARAKEIPAGLRAASDRNLVLAALVSISGSSLLAFLAGFVAQCPTESDLLQPTPSWILARLSNPKLECSVTGCRYPIKKVEARVACSVINRMTQLGMPLSQRVR